MRPTRRGTHPGAQHVGAAGLAAAARGWCDLATWGGRRRFLTCCPVSCAPCPAGCPQSCRVLTLDSQLAVSRRQERCPRPQPPGGWAPPGSERQAACSLPPSGRGGGVPPSSPTPWTRMPSPPLPECQRDARASLRGWPPPAGKPLVPLPPSPLPWDPEGAALFTDCPASDGDAVATVPMCGLICATNVCGVPLCASDLTLSARVGGPVNLCFLPFYWLRGPLRQPPICRVASLPVAWALGSCRGRPAGDACGHAGAGRAEAARHRGPGSPLKTGWPAGRSPLTQTFSSSLFITGVIFGRMMTGTAQPVIAGETRDVR